MIFTINHLSFIPSCILSSWKCNKVIDEAEVVVENAVKELHAETKNSHRDRGTLYASLNFFNLRSVKQRKKKTLIFLKVTMLAQIKKMVLVGSVTEFTVLPVVEDLWEIITISEVM